MSSDHLTQYQKKLRTAAEAMSVIRDHETLVHGIGVTEPQALLGALADRLRAGELSQIKIYSFNPYQTAANTYLAIDLIDCVEAYSWFVSAAARRQSAVGLVQFIPSYLHQVPRLIEEHLNLDTVVTTVSAMDNAGYFSYGVCNGFISSAARRSKKVIVEANPTMPRIFGDNLIHISEVDMVVENHEPILEMPAAKPRPEDATIGQLIADIVPEEATLQLGIGSLPNAICPFLKERWNLGIHTELFGPGMAELIRCGAANGSRKTLHPRRHVFSVAYGTRDTFDLMHDNPSMECYPSSYVMDPGIIARNDRMVAVNSILEVDLTGQCNAESIDGVQYSGTGGQLDFVRGAYASKGGMSIMAFYSTAKDGQISRVVPRLEAGATVTTPRMDVHYLATEYGVVNLKQKSVRERALAIISIAHPKFRDDLLREAEAMRLL